MTLLFNHKPVLAGSALLTLILPDRRLRLGLADSAAAGVLANCRMALSRARRSKTAVAFMFPRARGNHIRALKGLEPAGRDLVFEHNKFSFYDNPYFAEAAKEYSRLIIAGYWNPNGCMATIMDAVRAGHSTVLLRDAIGGVWPAGVFASGAHALSLGRICVCATSAWARQSSMPRSALTETQGKSLSTPTAQEAHS